VDGRRPKKPSYAERRASRADVDDPHVVLEAAGRFLEARPRSVAEVRRRLISAGYRPELIDDAITKLLEFGVLDDDAFARSWVESRDRARPRGERAIRSELASKGIDRHTIDAVLADRRSGTPDDAWADEAEASNAGAVTADRAAAERLLSKHARALSRIADPRQRRQRAYALLARNGFDSDTCRELAALAAVEVSAEPDGEV
jgi:SOS response regulatory protein OraA/RecX